MISIVIPAFNGYPELSKSLPDLIQHFKIQNYEFEIIVVDDGSEDGENTKKLCQEYSCIYLNNISNEGKGAAVKKGILHAKGEIKIFTDADIPFQHQNIDLIISSISNNEAEIVIGDRKLKDSLFYNKISFFRKWSSIIYIYTIGNILTKGLQDTQCGLKGFRKKVADDIFSKLTIKGFAFDVELLHIALLRKYRLKRIAVQIRNTETSTINIFKHSPGMLRDLFKIKLNNFKGIYS